MIVVIAQVRCAVNSSENEIKIKKMSRRLRLVFQFCLFLLPPIPVIYWLSFNHLPQVMHENIFASGPVAWLPLNSRLIAMAGGIPAIIVLIFALLSLKRLFALYENGLYFQTENVLLFRSLSRLALWSVLTDVFGKTVLELALTINNPPGHRVLSIGFSSDHLKLLIVAIVIMLISRVVEEGRKIHDEMQLTV